MNFDLSMPAQLTSALGPDLLLMGGAMLLLLWAGWRRESDEHQRSVGILSIVLCILTMIAVGYYAYQSYDTIETVFAHEEPQDVLEPVVIAESGDGGPVTLLPQLASANGTQVRIRNANEALPEEAGPPWKQRGRLNVLLLGADAGPGRGGLRWVKAEHFVRPTGGELGARCGRLILAGITRLIGSGRLRTEHVGVATLCEFYVLRGLKL
jgi:hypothetical protein